MTRAEDWIADYDDEALFDLFMLRTGVRRQPTAMTLETPTRSESTSCFSGVFDP